MERRVLIPIGAAVLLSSAFLFAQARPAKLVEGKKWFFDGMCNSPGLCVMEVDPYVADYRVECIQPGWEAVIWEGLPRPGDYIDTLGANWVKVQAFYSFPPGVSGPVGKGVYVKHAEYPARWSREERLRKTNTIRAHGPDWDFTFRDIGKSFDPCLRRAQEANYRVREPWGGPRFGGDGCRAVEGDWDWFNGGQVRLALDGAATGVGAGGKQADKGRWKCVDARALVIEILWAKRGWRDTLRLSADGKRLEGQDQERRKIWAVRAQEWDLDDCEAVAGAWKWFNGGVTVIDARGGVQGFARAGARPDAGSWRCVSGYPVTIRITWARNGWIDTLTLAASGRRLEGTNQQNQRIWGER